ncbi:filamentous hemagglutinin family protein [Pelomonas saccharophila]|uniref:Filamentous hemagglutinin family protein n=1 Tax=Roseateles saccharophilus TaxID=304 RepID=A0ABU1YVZ0_ROSSA|nr:autotransporter-associated beta strand repeat-containing protein [Roseateles saccharophilus]MDR7273034.1 filamentous hemagglutinin family protein [Roseateles saccharophilus]
MRRLQPLALALCLAAAYPVAQALPQGAQVVQGQVALSPGLIQQGSDKAIVNWQSFSIAAGEGLRIQQPSINSVLLNRVVGGDPSLILGQMQANGRVFLINPRGIVFGKGSQVDAGSLVASTLDLSDTQFLAGNYRFSAGTGTGAGALQADGSINAPGGTVALVAPQLNMSGSIAARRVGLGAASTVQVDVEGDGLVLFNLRNDDNRDVALKFSGRVRADGSAELRAQARAGAVAQVLNMDGIVQARGFSQQGGRIVIDGGTAGITSVNGRADASGETGGGITVLGQKLALLDGARLDASGRLGGGSLQVGGGFEGKGTAHNAEQTWVGAGAELRADATERGEGGRIAIWADGRTDMLGSIYARGGVLGGNGGTVETSGRQRLNLLGSVDASAPQGRPGQWLLDPNDVVIKANAGTNTNVGAAPNFASTNDGAVVDAGALNNALSGGTSVTVQTTSSGTDGEHGDIDVQAAIVPTGAATLNLIALRNITFSAAGGSIGAGAGALNVSLQAGGNITGTTINTGGGTLAATSSGAGTIGLGSVTSAGLTINTAGGDVVLPSGTVSGNLGVTSSGGAAITQAGALTVTGTTGVTTGSGNITLTAASNNLQGAVSLTTTGASQISNGSGNTLTLGTLNTHALTATATAANLNLGSGTVTGNLNATTTGSGTITQGGALTVTGTTTLSNGSGNITLASANDLQNAVNLTTTGNAQIVNGSGKALSLGTLSTAGLTVSTSNANLDLGSGGVTGNLSVTTSGTGTITQSGALTVTGTTGLSNGSGNITLTTATNDLQGAVSVTATGTTQLSNGSGKALTLGTLNTHALTVSTSGANLDLGSGTVTGNLSATTTGTGTLTQSGALTVTGTTTLSNGSGNITLTSGNDLQGAVSITSSGATQLSNANGNALTLGMLNTGNLTVSANHADLVLGSGTVGGNLSATTTNNGSLTQSGALTVTGTSTLSNGSGDITLSSANNLQGAVSVTTTGTTQIANGSGHALTLGTLSTRDLSVSTAAANLDLGSGTLTGNLSATTTGAGAITQTGVLTVTGTSSLSSGSGGITLAAANDLQGTVGITSTGSSQIVNGSGNALTLGTLNAAALTVSTSNADIDLGSGTVGGNFSATTTGNGTLTQSGALTVTGTSALSNGSGNITLASGNNLQGAVSVTTTGTTQLVNASGNALTLGTLSTHALTASTSNANLGLGSGTVTGNLGATTTGSGTLTQSGALTVTGTTTLSNGSGNITLAAANNLQGAVGITTTGTTQLVNGNGNALTLGTLSTHGLTVSTSNANLQLGSGTITGNLSAATTGTGTITQGGALVVTGTSAFSNGSGNITLTSANNLQGAVSLSTTGTTNLGNGGGNPLTLGTLSTGNLTVSTTAGGNLNLGSGSINGTLNASSHGGAISQSGALSVSGVATLDATTAGDIGLPNTGNQWNGLNLVGNSLDLRSAGDINILSLTQPANRALTLSAGANLILGPVASINTGTADLTLTSGGSFTMGGVLAGHNVELGAQTGLVLSQSITASGTLKLTTASGDVNQTGGSLLVTGATTVSAGASNISLNQSTNHFGGAVSLSGAITGVTDSGALTLGTLNTGDLTVTSSGLLNLGQGTVNGTLNATSNGFAISQSGGLTLTGVTTLDAGTADITLNQATNDLQGAITATGGAVSLRSANNLNLFALTQPGNRGLELEAGGTLILPAGTSNIDTGTEALTLSSGGVFATFGTLKGGAVTLKGQSATLAHDITASGALVVAATSGSIDQTGGRIVAASTSSFDAGGQPITLNSAANQFSGAVSLTGGNTLINNLGPLNLGAGSITGTLGATSSGAISQSGGPLSVSGAASFDASGADITLGDTGNSWGAAVALSGRNLILKGGSAITLGDVGATSLTLASGGSISQGAGTAVTLSGALGVDAGSAAITLANAGNQLGGTVTLKGGTTQLRTNGALTLGTLDTGALTLNGAGALNLGQGSVAGNLSATSGNGLITQAAGGLNVSGTSSINAGTADITLNDAANSWTGAVGLTGRDVQLTGSGAVALGTASIRSLVLKSGGAVTQSSPLSLTGALNVDAGSALITLNDAGNQLGGLVTLKGGITQVRTAAGLTLGPLNTGDLTVTASGALNLGQGNVSGDLVASSGNGAITQTAALQVSGAASFTSGTGNITLSNSGNQFLGALSLTGNAVTIFNQPSLNFGTLSFNSLDATSNGSIVLGSGTLSGALTAKALGGSITQIAGGLTVAGNATLQASTGITMTDAANHLDGTVNLSGGTSSVRNAGNLRLGTLATAGLTLNVAGTLNLGSGTVGGALTAVSTGAVSQTGALAVTGATSLNAGSASITLGQAGNSFTGSVDLRGGTTVITGAGALSLGSLNVAGLSASASGALRLGAGTVGGDLHASGNAITQAAGGLAVAGASTLNTGSGNIDLAEVGNAFAGAVSLVGGGVTLVNGGALRLGSFSARDLKVSAGGNLDLGGGTVNGELTATTRGNMISQSAALTVRGVANFVADGGLATLVLDQPGNQLLGGITMHGINGGSFASADISSALDLTFSGDVRTLKLSSGGLLTLGGGHNDTLSAAAANGILLTGPLEVTGLTTLIANGTNVPVDLATHGADNDLNRVELKAQPGASLGRVQLRDGDAARHDGLKVTGDAAQLELTSAGTLDLGGGSYGSLKMDTAATGAEIKQSGALTVSGLTTIKAGAGQVTLDRPDNNLPSFTLDSAGIAGLASLGDYTLNTSQVSTRLELGGAGAISLVGPLSGTGELVMKGSGSLTMTTAQGYGGGTRIESGTVVLAGPLAQAGSGAVQLQSAGQLDLRDGAVMGAELVANGGRVINTSGAGTLAGGVTLKAPITEFLPGAGGLTVSGSISDGGAGFGLRLASGGTLTLAGSNHYSGITDVASGTLRITGELPSTSAVQLASGAVLALGKDQAIGSLAGAGRVELGSFTLGTGLDGRDSSFSGSLVGTGGLTKLGSGRFTLSGSGAHTGATRVAAGELVLASATALNDVTAVSVDAGATLTVQQSLNLGSLAGAGTVDVQAALLGVGSNGSSTRWDGAITGPGGLAKLGAGVFTLAGHNTLAGDLQVNAGTLQLEGAGAVRPLAAGLATGPVVPTSAGVSVADGATLELLSDIDLGALSGAGQVQLNSNTLSLGASGRSSRFDGVMAGSGGLTKTGSGTLTLGGTNLYSGTTRVSGGSLVLDGPQALASASALVIEAPGQVQAHARQTVASLSGNGALVLDGASLAAGADGSDSRFDGVVSGSGGLIKQGAGTLTLTAAHSNSGATVIEAGAVQLSGNGALGSGEIQNQGELRLSRSEALTLDQAISGRGSLVITQGQVTLNSAANSYSGATQVQGGSLITTAVERLSDASAVQVAAGAQLQLGGNETIASLQAAGSVKLAGHLTTTAEQVYTGSLTLSSANGQTLTGTLIDASRSSNQFGSAPLALAGGQALVTVKDSLQLGDVNLSNGGRIEADRLAVNGKLQLTGGSLALVAKAAPDDAKATLQGTAQVPVAGQSLAIAEATVQQGSASTITVAENAKLQVQAAGGGSVVLAQDANSFKGQLSVLSGANFNTAWLPNAKGNQAVQSQVRVSGQQVMVGGSGIEADLVYIRADQLATVGDAKLVARMPFDEIVLGKALSAPGMLLELAPGAFGTPGSFGSINGQPIRVEVGSTLTGNRTTGPNAGYLSLLPKAGAQGSTAVVLVGPEVGSAPASGGPGYRFFHDGASQATEIPVVYNGVLPLTPAASGALSSINGDAEDARRARFQETVRTENVTVRLRSGVIAEVGPGRPSTQGSEGAKPPELCDPAAQPVLGCKPANP